MMSKHFLNFIRVAAMTISLGRLFQNPITFSVKNLFLISNLNICKCSFMLSVSSRPLYIFVALFWTFSSSILSLYCGTQNFTEYLKWGFTCRGLGQSLPQLVTYAVFEAPQNTVGPPGCQGTVLIHSINQNPQVSFCRDAPQPLIPQSVYISRITLSQVQNLVLVLVKVHSVGDCPAF